MSESGRPLVVIVMGSDSDLPLVEEAAGVLEELGVACELHVASAHRTPERAVALAREARPRGVKVIIAAAGMAAHLAGVLAAHTTLPVIGLPIASGALGGVDALLSTVQMPDGVPVAAVAINGARNAGLLAAEIIATSDDALAQRLSQMRDRMAKKVEDGAARLKERP